MYACMYVHVMYVCMYVCECVTETPIFGSQIENFQINLI